MDHYIDIRLRQDPEFSTAQFMGTLFSKLHHALVQSQADDIGVSFPQFDGRRVTLGDHLRLHGTQTRLQVLYTQPWLQGMQDHVMASPPQPAPGNARHRIVRRVQSHSNADRIRRRQMRRKGWTYEEACQHIPDTVERLLPLPHVHLRSSSTGQNFALFIEHLAVQDAPVAGQFSTYGLSPSATVPWF